MKVLVSAASKYGATAEIARSIGDLLWGRGHDLQVLAPEDLEATGAREHRVFPGRIVRKQLSFPERAMVGALRVPDGDFRDWPEIEAWPSGIAVVLAALP